MKKTLPLILSLFITVCTIAQPTTKQVILSAGSVTTAKVPPGVTSLTIEAWGGGSHLGGGQGGGYFKSTIPVNPGDDMAILVGAGGNGGTVQGVNGSNTIVEIKHILPGTTDTQITYKFVAEGGTGSNNGIPRGSYRDTNTRHGFDMPIPYPFIGYTGGNGSATIISALEQRTDESLIGTSVGGNGGDGANTTNTKGTGGSETRNLSKYGYVPFYEITDYRLPLREALEPTPGLTPGGGGGGATSFDKHNTGANGGGGLVIISFS